MIKLCIFDLDGTLADSLGTIAYFCNFALNAVGLGPIDEEKYKFLVGDGRNTLIHRILQYHNADTPEMFEKTRTIYDRAYEADPLGKTTAFDGIDELLESLKAKNILLAVCSNKPHNVVSDIVQELFGDTFAFVTGLKDGQNKKPAPDTAIEIADKLQVLPKECLFIGDTNVDILTAKNAKMLSCGVLWGFRDYDELSEAGADFIIDNPSEIINIVNGD